MLKSDYYERGGRCTYEETHKYNQDNASIVVHSKQHQHVASPELHRMEGASHDLLGMSGSGLYISIFVGHSKADAPEGSDRSFPLQSLRDVIIRAIGSFEGLGDSAVVLSGCSTEKLQKDDQREQSYERTNIGTCAQSQSDRRIKMNECISPTVRMRH